MEKTVKTIISLATNWRIASLTIMWAVAILLLMCESEDIMVFITIKALGFALAGVAWNLGKRWESLMPELGVFNDDDPGGSLE